MGLLATGGGPAGLRLAVVEEERSGDPLGAGPAVLVAGCGPGGFAESHAASVTVRSSAVAPRT
ncbi:hypothetical protein KCMC57_up57380 [Kitasatospora sp. CMC57]|uniref:Uncharacterized protein n=1 Tax=Kitasatospora sp. CMC57 TaxID=3231513 RepID=A0AB33KA65_9ACTN